MTMPPVWNFEAPARLSSLAVKARSLAEALRRERCRVFDDKPRAAALWRRAEAHDRRAARFEKLARVARREAPALATA